ncbi:putative T7SS-secreted protein [Kitasatospora purpeofusca]|uniref:Putative T7SS secretion signal domain-containing protein n=1 Tax=Kitasatospora purpeofusca TaxID=67352 RepID=A0ABZ1TTZ2_9ACTN|nr:hypothetical protein [Kitasatospora purpeofusca]
MPQRPTDWNAIGLSADPTPGDPDRIDEVQRSLADLGRTAREIDDALAAVLDKTGQGAFTGQTADALRDKISGPLRAFVQSVADGFENSARALTTYAGVVRDQQWRADNALSQGRGLAQDDTRRTELAGTARQAGTAQDEAGRTAGSALSSAARGIKQPVSDCDLFWEAFQWLAIALILPALIFGGPIALIAIGVNLAIFVKTAVDFSQGKASALDLFLSGLGMIAPTTKGLPLLKLISAGAKFTWTGIKGVAQAVGGFFRGVFTGGGSHAFAFLPGLADLARMTGGWVRAGGLWVLNGVTRLPHFAGVTFRASGIAVVNGVKGLPALVRGLPANLGRFGSASWDFARAQLGGAKWLRLVLPVDAAEIGRYGLRGALRIGFWERGVLGNFRYGAPLLGAAGRTAAAVPVPPPVHTVDALVDLSRTDLAKVRVGDWAGPRRLEIPHPEASGSGLSYTRPSDFRLHNDLADRLSLAPDAVRRLDALLDTPIRELHPVGSWAGGTVVTPGGLHVETGLGVSAAPGGLHGIGGLTGAPTPAPVHLADTLSAGGPATAHAPNLQTQALALHQTGGAPTALGTGALHTLSPATPAVHTADLLTSSTAVPHLTTGTLPTAAVHGTALPSTVTGAVTVPGPGAVGPGTHLNGALDLLATGSPLNRADAPVFGAGGNLGDHSTRALAANQVNLHLGEFTAPRVTPAPALPPVHAVTPPTALGGASGPGGVTDLGVNGGFGANGGLGRVDEALGLLQPGPGHGAARGLADPVPAAPVPLPPAVVGSTPLPPAAPLVQGPAAPLPPAAPAHPAAGSAHDLPTVPAVGGHGGPERLTGAQLDRLWREQGDRVAGLFGATDDPGRGARLDAWADLTLARHDLGRAERLSADLRARPGSGSRPSPVVIHAQASVDAAALKVDAALDRVTGLGIDPARMDRDLAALSADSLRERPRLLGGAESGGGMPQHLNPQPQLAPNPAPQHVQPQHVQAQPPVPQPPAPQPVVLALADQGTAGPNGLRIESTTTPNGTVHRVLDAHHVPDPMLQPTPRPGGGFDLHDTRLGTTHSYDGNGRLVAEELPLTGLDGAPAGYHVHTDFDAQGAATHRVHDPDGVTPLQAAPRPGGGFDLRDPATGGHRGFDHAGRLVEEGRPLLRGDGSPFGPVLLLGHDNGTVTRSLSGGGHTLTELPGGAGLRVTDPVTGRSALYDDAGAFRAEGVALGDGAGVRGGRFVVPQGGGGHVLTDAAGAVLPERVVTHPGGGFRVEGAPAVPGGGASYERFAADGTPTAGGRQLLDGNGTVVGHRERPVPAPGHVPGHAAPPAGQPAWLDAAFQPDATRVVTADGAGLRVTAPGGSYRVLDDAGRLTDDAARLHAPGGGALDQWVAVHTPPGGPRTLRVLDGTGTPVPNLTAADRPAGGFQVTDAAADNGFVRYGADGTRLETGTALRGPDGNPDRTFAVLPPPGPGAALPGHLEDAAGLRIPERTVTVRADGGLQVSVDRPNGPRHGEFSAHAPGDGRITHQGFNVIDGGRRTDHQYVVDHTPAAGATWSRQPHPAAAVPPPAGTGAFHHGRVESIGGGDRIRLLSSTYTPVEVFERRVLPGGGLLDSFRRTDTLLFGDLDRRTVWTQWDAAGGLGAHGTRRYDTSGFGWRDLDHRGNPVHEYRDGLQKTGGVTGHTFAVRNADRSWTWHRFDGAGQELAHGPRTLHRDSGWSDRLADGTLVQKQWGMGHGPGRAGQFLEHTWQGGGVRQTWERHSPHGKEVGKREVLATDNAVLTTTRWSEQRPPLWVRRHLVGAGGPQGVAAHLADDTRYQVFLWDKAGGVNPGGGVRYVGMDGAAVDLGADGRFVRSTGKLHGGTTLKVGDHAHPPAHPPTNPAHLPWEEPGRRGYRAEVVPPAGAGRDHPLWQDRFSPDGGANWQVAREGFADGSVREYRVPPQVDPATAHVQGRGTHAWVQRDAHGNLTGSHDIWQDAQGNRLEVTGTGRPDSGRWTWTATDHLGNRTTGRRESFRGSDDPRMPWDDSFRDFDAGGALLRERNMLDGGRWVDSWRGAAPPGGGQRWHTAKYEANGTAVDFGAGQQVRRWWNADTRAWQDGWTARTRHFRDEFRPAGGPALTLREVPPHLALGEGPLRVRQYVPGGNAPHPAGSWKEFDHGAVVRERKPLGDGTFLEKDAWRGQWRRYDQHHRIIAQRTDSGLVWETGPGGNLRVTGNEYDFRGPLTEIRGFGRRVREANRLPWGDSVEVRVPLMQNALAGVPGLPAARNGAVPLGEALYQPYWKVLAKKVALEFGQEFVLEFGANLAVNGIVAAANNKPFTGKDVLKSFANAAVGAGVKSLVSTGMHELRGSSVGGPKSVFGNVDGGKHERRHPNNHDKHWANEWAGNETPTRWRGGTYDFFYNAALGGVVGWVNGAMNAAVWGVTGADGKTHVLSGMDAFLDGGIAGLAGLTTASSAALAKNAVIAGGGSRFFHRQGFAEFWLQLPFKIFEKTVTSLWLTNAYRASIDPAWYRAPLPAPAPAPAPKQGQQP